MPKKFDSCVREVNKLIKRGKIKKTYLKNGKRRKTNPYAICRSTHRKSK